MTSKNRLIYTYPSGKSDYKEQSREDKIYLILDEQFHRYHENRISGQDILKRYHSLALKVKNITVNVTNGKKYDLLLARIYHQIGIIYQNSGDHKTAEKYLKLAADIRKIYNDSEYALTRFQIYMNAQLARSHGNLELLTQLIESLGESNWENVLCDEIVRNYASRSAETDESPEKNSMLAELNINNTGYIYQTCHVMSLCENGRILGIYPDKKIYYLETAILKYRDGLKHRVTCDDCKIISDEKKIRLVAQTLVRLSQCYIYAIIHIETKKTDPINDLKKIAPYISIIYLCIEFITQVYVKYPQEENRMEDLKNLKIDVNYYASKYQQNMAVQRTNKKIQINCESLRHIICSFYSLPNISDAPKICCRCKKPFCNLKKAKCKLYCPSRSKCH